MLQTATRIKNFISNVREPQPGQKIVYYQASCDLFHPGVIERIKQVKQHGDFLYVGLWSDEMIRYYRGDQFPLVCLQERLLMLLCCKFVDDIVVEAPYIVTKDLLTSLNIDKVVNVVSADDKVLPQHQDIDPYQVCKDLGVYVEERAAQDELTVEKIAMRVQAN